MALGPIRLEQDQTTAQLQVQKVRAGGCQEERVGTEVVVGGHWEGGMGLGLGLSVRAAELWRGFWSLYG